MSVSSLGQIKCAHLNYGHPWDTQSELAMALLGRILESF